MTTTFENAKVGDRVYSLRLGRFLPIKRIDDSYCLPIVLGAGCTEYYLGYDGCAESGKVLGQTYFWDKPTIIAPEQPKPKREAPSVDTLVEVRDCDHHEWIKRYSSGKLEGDRLFCFVCGATSKTEDSYTAWSQWRIAEDNDGWIEWNGSKCPIAPWKMVRVKFANGKEDNVKAAEISWDGEYNTDWKIIAYKVAT